MDDRILLLERLHVALVASIERANSSYLRDPFTVREIYEDLIPYRTHRDLIGVAMNGDYEDGLMRILAGHGDYLILESPEVREALNDELEKKDADTGLFKKYADEGVRLNPEVLGMSPPPTPSGGVARLFQPDPPQGPEPAKSRWDLRSRSPAGGDRKGSTEGGDDAQKKPQAARRATRDPEVLSGEGPGQGVDQVGTSQKFWMEAAPPPAEDERPPLGGKADRLEDENRRLKILLAERVLEVEELREQLSKGDAEVHREES